MTVLDACYFQELIKFDTQKPTSSTQEIIFVAIAAVILNNIIYNVAMKHFSKEFTETLQEEYEEELESTKDNNISPMIYGLSEMLNSAIYAPMVEELFFRFLLLKLVLIKMFDINKHKANLIHAIIFGAMHMTNAVVSDQQINRTIIQSVMSGIGGFISGYTYMYTNSIFTPLLSHMINNAMAAGSQVIDYAKTYNMIKESFKILIS
jgi:membrane protease YdiL (CAAX protease family)